MRTIDEYKNRFNQLLESKSGDVKPLITEKNWFKKMSDKVSDVFSSKREDEWRPGGYKYNYASDLIDDFEKKYQFKELYTINKKNRPITYEVAKIDNCDENRVYDIKSLGGHFKAKIFYCDYNDEVYVDELDKLGDDMWLELKKEAEDKYDNFLEKNNMPNSFLEN
jgi:hypothetical protein